MAFNLDDFVKKYDVHRETLEYLSSKYADGVKQGIETGVEGARLARIEGARRYAGSTHFEGTEKDFTVPSKFCKEGIPITVYKPTCCAGVASPTILVYFHGGGNVVACRKTHESVCKILARDCPCIVANVEYRLSPEHKYPACHDDAKCVIEWVTVNKTTIGGFETSKVGVCGDSAGGRIAATVCHEAKQLINLAVLVYPSVNFSQRYPSEEEFKDGPALSKPIRDWYTAMYLNSDADRLEVRASPLLNKDFTNLPPTLIIVAELDPLRDGCRAYFDKLKKAGIMTDIHTVRGVPHGFWSLPAAFPSTCQEAYSVAVRFIQNQ